MTAIQQQRDIGGAGLPVDRHDREQHQDRAQQRVEEEFERRINPARPTPDTDDEKHRDQAAFEEDIEHHQIERAEHADHQRFEQQKRDHIFPQAAVDRLARDDADRREEGGQDDEQDGNSVHAHFVADAAAKPIRRFHKLEIGRAGVEIRPQKQRQHEIDQR